MATEKWNLSENALNDVCQTLSSCFCYNIYSTETISWFWCSPYTYSAQPSRACSEFNFIHISNLSDSIQCIKTMKSKRRRRRCAAGFFSHYFSDAGSSNWIHINFIYSERSEWHREQERERNILFLSKRWWNWIRFASFESNWQNSQTPNAL